MNCNAALAGLLDAEPSELAGIGSTPIALHVRSCAKCEAVASRLLAETRALALAVNYKPTLDLTPLSSRERPRPAIVLAASIGSIAAFVLVGFIVEYSLRARIEAGPISQGTGAASSTADSPGPAARRKRVAARDAFVAPLPDTAAARVHYVTAVPAAPVAYTPSAVDQTAANPANARIDDGSSVSVDLPAGRRVTVMRGRFPSITVVWTY